MNTKHLISLLLLSALLAACGPKLPEPVPGDIIQPEQMTRILVDVQLAEGYIARHQRQSSDAKKFANLYYPFIFHKHNITLEEFKKSMDYYVRHTDRLTQMLDDAVTLLSLMEGDLKKEN